MKSSMPRHPFPDSQRRTFLKFVLADERIRAVIPRTSNPAPMAGNPGAMRGRLPDPDQRKRKVALIASL